MGKRIPDAIIDAQLDLAEGDQIHACSAEPTTALQATTTFNLATDVAGTYFKANGDVSGRKNTQAGTTNSPIATTGLVNHIAVTSNAGTTLKQVTTCTPQALTAGGTVSIGPWAHEIGDAQ